MPRSSATLRQAFPLLRQLRPEIIRMTMWWGGRAGVSVAQRRPDEPANPADPAYDWAIYDGVIRRAAEGNMRVLLGIQGTPGWANGGKRFNRAPTNASTLRAFAHAAATRYSGTFTPEGAEEPLPAVRFWLAWNEPNDPVFLAPQYRKVNRRWVMQSPRDYARICNAVVSGVRTTMLRNEKIGCGVTSPRGNNKPGSRRAVDRAAHVPAGDEEGRRPRLRRVRAPSVLREPERVACEATVVRDHARRTSGC